MEKLEANPISHKKIDITAILYEFNNLKPRFPYSLIPITPFVLVLWLLFDWTLGKKLIIGDYFRFSWYFMAIMALLLINFLVKKNRSLLVELCQKGVVDTSSIDNKTRLRRFVANYEYWIFNKTYGSVLGIMFMIGIFACTYPVIYWLTFGSNVWPSLYQWVYYYFYGILSFIDILVAFPVGLAFWQFGVMSWFLQKLGLEFIMRVQFSNPDNCGGLRSVGNICLYNSIVILVPSLVLSGWIIAAKIPRYQGFSLWSPYLQVVLVTLILLSILVFFRPLFAIHRQMETQRDALIRQTAKLSLLIEKKSQSVHNKIHSMSTAEINREMEAINRLKIEYLDNMKAPVWPFDRGIFAKFISTVLIPLLTPLGITELILKMISSIFRPTPP